MPLEQWEKLAAWILTTLESNLGGLVFSLLLSALLFIQIQQNKKKYEADLASLLRHNKKLSRKILQLYGMVKELAGRRVSAHAQIERIMNEE